MMLPIKVKIQNTMYVSMACFVGELSSSRFQIQSDIIEAQYARMDMAKGNPVVTKNIQSKASTKNSENMSSLNQPFT